MIDPEELALENDRSDAVEWGYADGDDSKFVRWMLDRMLPIAAARLLVANRDPSAKWGSSGEDDFVLNWYQLDTGEIVGIPEWDTEMGYLIKADDTLPLVEDYKVPIVPPARVEQQLASP